MQNIQASYKQFPNYIFLILYLITGSLSNFGAIDILAPQWIYLGCINILVCSYILFFASNEFNGPFAKLFSSFYIYSANISIYWLIMRRERPHL